MAGQMLGFDPDQLKALAKDNQTAGSAWQHTSVTLPPVHARARWNGPDADRMRQNWSTDRQPMKPAYQNLLTNNPALTREIFASDFNGKVDDARPTNNILPIAGRILAGGFETKCHQR